MALKGGAGQLWVKIVESAPQACLALYNGNIFQAIYQVK